MEDTPLGPGSLLAGRFVLDDLLEEDAGARLWRATDRVLARSVAVHVLPDSDVRAGALLTAARTSALVSDVRLLRVLDAAAEDEVVYVVNEWGNGISLDRLLADGPLQPRRAAWVVREVAEAIATAHRHGVAHGRLLPENVMVSDTGSVKVIGFVVASVLRSEPDFSHHRVTGGDPVDAFTADVLNLGALLYAALVGRWPGTVGSSVPAAPTEHGRPLRPRQVRAGVPRPLDAICERVLNGDLHPQATPLSSAYEVYAALSDYIGDPVEAVDPLAPATLAGPARSDAGPLGGPVGAPPTDALDTIPGGPGAGTGTDDPDATQAAGPVFADESGDTGDTGDTGEAPTPSRPLFADETAEVAPNTGAAQPPRTPSPVTGPWSAGADDRAAGHTSHTTHTSHAVSGAPDPGHPGPPGHPDHAGRGWLRAGVVLAAVVTVVVAAVVALDLTGDGGDGAAPGEGSSPSAQPSRPVRIAQVSDFDPQGDPPSENPDLAPLAADGRTSTAWHTSTYYDPLPRLKSGVGLLVDLGKPSRVGDVRLTLEGSPTSLRLLAAPGARTAPSSTDGLRTVASRKHAGTSVNLSLAKPVSTRWLVVWLTSLPKGPGGWVGAVAEISVRT